MMGPAVFLFRYGAGVAAALALLTVGLPFYAGWWLVRCWWPRHRRQRRLQRLQPPRRGPAPLRPGSAVRNHVVAFSRGRGR